MKFKIVERGMNRGRYSYGLEFSARFSEKQFVDGLNIIASAMGNYNFFGKNSRYMLIEGYPPITEATRAYARMNLLRMQDPRKVVLSVQKSLTSQQKRKFYQQDKIDYLIQALFGRIEQIGDERKPAQPESQQLNLPLFE